MSGHSKWSTIKHKKAITDAKKGAAFSKIARLIEVSARSGPDPEMNFRLKLAIQKARAVNMPAANIDKAIKKGSGQDKDASSIEEVAYEGMGPAGVAIIVQVFTDNKNRTVADLRNLFNKYGGSLGNSGSVAWQFKNRGLITVANNRDDIEMAAIDAGADDVENLGEDIEIHTDPKQLAQVKTALEASGLTVKDAKLAMIPTQTIKIADVADAKKVLGFMDALEENDDVSEVFTNFDIDEQVMNQLAQ